MEKIKPGKYVEITYDLYQVNEDGSEKLVHQVVPEDPEKFVFGVTRGMIEPLEAALDGKEPGDTYDVVVSANDAFGPYEADNVVSLDKEIFMVDGKFDNEMVKPGALVPMMTAEGFRINGLVKEVSDKVVMDFNHPLAGKDVRFKGEVKTVRDATPEELQPAHGCGCGCGCHDDHECGDDCECGCGEHDHHCGDDCGCGCN